MPIVAEQRVGWDALGYRRYFDNIWIRGLDVRHGGSGQRDRPDGV